MCGPGEAMTFWCAAARRGASTANPHQLAEMNCESGRGAGQ